MEQKDGFFQSTTAKMLMVGFLTLILLIPLLFVQNLIEERGIRQKVVVDEVSELWGKEVQFYGPIMQIPFKTFKETTVVDIKTKLTSIQQTSSIEFAYFFPERLNNESDIKKNTSLKRGIYNNIVFSANMKFTGNFSKPNFEKLGIKEDNVLWDKASIIVKTTNLKSIKSDLKIKLNNQLLSFESKPEEDKYYGTLETSNFNQKLIAINQSINFNFTMQYNGSDNVSFIPVGKTTFVSIDSDWESPSFNGAFAANNSTKKINKKGFHADWKILDINRSFSQQYINKIPDLKEYSFGVKLIETVDEYLQNERASKYGFLVIGLTFLIFFLIQSISKISIHIFQYSMIGLALVMFYTLLISITEHSSFSFAYAIAATSVVALITFYSISILKNKKFPMFIAIALSVLYTFIFIIIQLEDYALLVGSVGLFMILGAVMYFSRKIDWNK